MRVIEPYQLQARKVKQKRGRLVRLSLILFCFILITTAGYTVWVYQQPLPLLTPTQIRLDVPIQQVALPWPAYGQAAIGTLDSGLLKSTANQRPMPMASVAKTMVAIATLRKYPLQKGQQGSIFTITADDIEAYQNYYALNGSVLPVVEGEQLTQYQALQALLIPSANNIADLLAVWAFGSMQGYLQYANDLAQKLGMKQTRFDDASGFSAQTVSTADDLIILGQEALQNSVIAEIANQRQATLPVAGKVMNVNTLLGQRQITGIKTGNTDEAGGCYLFSANYLFAGGQNITLIGAVMGAPSLGAAMRDSLPLIDATVQGFGDIPVAKATQKVGSYSLPWAGTATATVQKDLSVFGWKETAFIPFVELQSITAPKDKQSVVGSVGVNTAAGKITVPVVLDTAIVPPNWRWRLTRDN